MANYHVTNGTENGNRFNVVMHIPIPPLTNEVNYDWQLAIVERQGGAPIQSQLVNIGVEQSLLDAGSLYEVTEVLKTHPGESLIEKRNKLDAMYAARVLEEQGKLQNELYFWGYERDVP